MLAAAADYIAPGRGGGGQGRGCPNYLLLACKLHFPIVFIIKKNGGWRRTLSVDLHKPENGSKLNYDWLENYRPWLIHVFHRVQVGISTYESLLIHGILKELRTYGMEYILSY